MNKEERIKAYRKVFLFRKWMNLHEKTFLEKDDTYKAHLMFVIEIYVMALKQYLCGYSDKTHQLYKVTPKMTKEELFAFLGNTGWYNYFMKLKKDDVIERVKEILDNKA